MSKCLQILGKNRTVVLCHSSFMNFTWPTLKIPIWNHLLLSLEKWKIWNLLITRIAIHYCNGWCFLCKTYSKSSKSSGRIWIYVAISKNLVFIDWRVFVEHFSVYCFLCACLLYAFRTPLMSDDAFTCVVLILIPTTPFRNHIMKLNSAEYLKWNIKHLSKKFMKNRFKGKWQTASIAIVQNIYVCVITLIDGMAEENASFIRSFWYDFHRVCVIPSICLIKM